MEQKLSTNEILAAARKVKGTAPSVLSQLPKPRERRIDARDDAAIHKELVAFWDAIAESCSALPAGDWDVVIGRLGDNGWITFGAARCLLPFNFPSTRSTLHRAHDHFRLNRHAIVSVFVLDHAQRLPERDDDDAYTLAFDELSQQKLKQLQASLHDSKLPELLQLANAFGVFATIDGQDVHEVNLLPLLGTLPKPPPPRTALEAFSRLFQHAELSIGKNSGLTFDGEELVGVTLLGANVSDATLALLDDLENFPELCRHMHSIALKFTRVTPTKALALQDRLPHVKVVY